VKVLQSIRPLDEATLPAAVVRGQYTAGVQMESLFPHTATRIAWLRRL
jgi:Glucose-6-phosphate dehydrogenase, C-terminal domain.